MSQQQLSEKTGVHRNYIGGIERGERNPSIDTIHKLAQAVDVEIHELFAEP